MGFFKEAFMRGDKKDYLLNHDDTAFNYFIFVVLACIFLPLLYTVFKRLIQKICGWEQVPLKYRCSCPNCTQTKEKHRKTISASWLTCGFVIQVLVLIAAGYALAQVAVDLGKEKKDIKKFDPYNILGLQTNATDEDIKLAYRRLARELHPDKNPDDPEAAAKFILLTKAYRALSDEEGKRNYIRYGNPEGPGALQVGIALPEFLIKKENHVTVLVCFFFILLILIPGGGLYWYSTVSKFNKHGIYDENMKRYGPLLNENLALKKFPFVMATTVEFEENLSISAEEQPALQKVCTLYINHYIVIDSNKCGETEEPQAKNLQGDAVGLCLYAGHSFGRSKVSFRPGLHLDAISKDIIIHGRTQSGILDVLQADRTPGIEVLTVVFPGS
eukprot:TRINITY_DN329_c0_g4_i3.p1 TRINITY_DN329_c0_g4~~TRINITY_DN329_c0_g4_i3.p1  ORF type:complete len:433 (-),score=35.29 TRINITY_DN329_c0_g4_i3:919-2079(-)